MGQAHFIQMYAEALAIDKRAMLQFIPMLLRNKHDDNLFGVSFWRTIPADVVMDKARMLVDVGDFFLEDLMELLVDGKIHVHFAEETGAVHKVVDPRIFTIDSPELSDKMFFKLMLTCPVDQCGD